MESGGGGGVGGILQRDGISSVAGFARFGLKRNFAQKRDVEALRFFFSAVFSEKVIALAVVAVEVSHVFDEAKNRDVDFGKHGGRFACIDERHFLRRGDDDGAVEGDGLDDGELDVAGARWEVKDEDIEFTPSDLAQKLLGVTVGERAAHDDG